MLRFIQSGLRFGAFAVVSASLLLALATPASAASRQQQVPVPEPTSLMVVTGLVGAALMSKKRAG